MSQRLKENFSPSSSCFLARSHEFYLRYLRRIFFSLNTKPSRNNLICMFHQSLDSYLDLKPTNSSSEVSESFLLHPSSIINRWHDADREPDSKPRNWVRSAITKRAGTAIVNYADHKQKKHEKFLHPIVYSESRVLMSWIKSFCVFGAQHEKFVKTNSSLTDK